MNIVRAVDEYLAKKIRVSPHPHNRASEAGHPCERFLVLARTKNELRALPDLGLQRIFEEGNLHEASVLQLLQAAGLRILEQQRSFEWKRYELSGHIDAMLVAESGEKIPLEIKSASPNAFLAVTKLQPMELLKSKYSWQRKYPAQLTLYMLMSNSENGILLFKNKVTGALHQLDFSLNDEALEYGEQILQKLERVNQMIRAGKEPEAVRCPDCKGCPFEKTACFPGVDYGEGYDFLDEPQLLEKLERRKELQDAAEEYTELDKELKETLRGKNTIVGGKWLVETATFVRTTYEVPKDVKEKYKTTTQYQVVKIEEI